MHGGEWGAHTWGMALTLKLGGCLCPAPITVLSGNMTFLQRRLLNGTDPETPSWTPRGGSRACSAPRWSLSPWHPSHGRGSSVPAPHLAEPPTSKQKLMLVGESLHGERELPCLNQSELEWKGVQGLPEACVRSGPRACRSQPCAAGTRLRHKFLPNFHQSHVPGSQEAGRP